MQENTGAIRRRNGTRLSRFVFTINNYSAQEEADLKKLTHVKWLIFGKEKGEEGTPHLQGACVIGKQVAFTTLKKWKGLERAHIEPMHGTPMESLVYCTKEDKDAYQFGEMPAEGKRNDLHTTISLLKEGKSIRDIVNSDDISSISTIVRYPKGLNAVANLLRLRGRKPPNVFWIHGSTGVGKTRCAFEFGHLFGGEDGIWMSSGSLKWFDGYDGQQVAIFDDLRTKHVEFSMLLRLLDRYPLRVEIKGGYVQWVPEVIIVTAPMNPEMMWNLRRNEDIQQLIRRITLVIELTADNVKECEETLAKYLPQKGDNNENDVTQEFVDQETFNSQEEEVIEGDWNSQMSLEESIAQRVAGSVLDLTCDEDISSIESFH